MSAIKSAGSLLLVLLLVGCGAMPHQWMPPLAEVKERPQPCRTDKVCIYIFRSGYYGLPYHLIVKDNDKKVGETGPDSYLSWERNSGEFVLSSLGEDEFMISVSVEPGKNYYWLQVAQVGTYSSRSTLLQLTEDEALPYFKKCRPAKLSNGRPQ